MGNRSGLVLCERIKVSMSSLWSKRILSKEEELVASNPAT